MVIVVSEAIVVSGSTDVYQPLVIVLYVHTLMRIVSATAVPPHVVLIANCQGDCYDAIWLGTLLYCC